MIKRNDATQGMVDVSFVKRYDTATNQWVDVGFVKRYDEATQSWISVFEVSLEEYSNIRYNDIFEGTSGNAIKSTSDGNVAITCGPGATVSLVINKAYTDAVIEGDIVLGPSEHYINVPSGYVDSEYSHRYSQWYVNGMTYNDNGTSSIAGRVTLLNGYYYKDVEQSDVIHVSMVLEGSYDWIEIVFNNVVSFSDVEGKTVSTNATFSVDGVKYGTDVNITIE